MIYHENRLLADDSHEISYLFFFKIRKDVTKFVVSCSRDWLFKGLGLIKIQNHLRQKVFINLDVSINFCVTKKYHSLTLCLLGNFACF